MMKKRYYIILAVVLLCVCFVYNIVVDSRYVLEKKLDANLSNTDQLQITVEQDKEILKIANQQIVDGKLYITLESVSPGKAYVVVSNQNKSESSMWSIYVHRFGIITEENFFGKSTGSWSIDVASIVFVAVLIVGMCIHIKREMHRNLYQYKNVRNIAFVLILITMLAEQLINIFSIHGGIVESAKMLLNFAGLLSFVVLPAALITFLLVTISNIQLMRKEGRNWRNMLGCILGITVCLGTIFPYVLGEFLQQTTIVDVHNENGMALYIELLVENTVFAITAYLESTLVGTMILSSKAAKRIPAWDKDYILILGCQIRKDGTLTNLLKSRADRAIEFAKMQKDAVGKDITFVPSGGKGDDEVISEAEAIRNYLVETGIPEDRILVENQSANTLENLRNSMELIRKDGKTEDPKIAFSTTNYHVFRSGVFASQLGIKAEGIGAKTKRYFWINAFIREFIAALVSEWKTHLAIMMGWIVMIISMVGIVFFSNNF